MLLLVAGPCWTLADDLSAKVTAPATVTGDGTQLKPFVFPVGSKGKLSIATDADAVTWILDGCQAVDPEMLPGGRVLWFETRTPGKYPVFIALAKQVKEAEASKLVAGGTACWFEIAGPVGPPSPVVETLRSRTVAALAGPDAKADAGKLSGIVGAVADALADGEYADAVQLNKSWNTALQKGAWPTGKYPAVPQIFRDIFELLPAGSEGIPLPDQVRKTLIENLRLVESAADEVSRA